MVNTLYWFRKALRLHDNPSLVRALQDASHGKIRTADSLSIVNIL